MSASTVHPARAGRGCLLRRAWSRYRRSGVINVAAGGMALQSAYWFVLLREDGELVLPIGSITVGKQSLLSAAGSPLLRPCLRDAARPHRTQRDERGSAVGPRRPARQLPGHSLLTQSVWRDRRRSAPTPCTRGGGRCAVLSSMSRMRQKSSRRRLGGRSVRLARGSPARPTAKPAAMSLGTPAAGIRESDG